MSGLTQMLRRGADLVAGSARRGARRAVARGRLGHEVALVYHVAYAVPGLAYSARVPHVLPERGELVIGQMASEGRLSLGDLRRAPLASLEELRRFHSLSWLEASDEAETLGRVFGLEAEHVAVGPFLRAQRRMVGGTLTAARIVRRRERRIAFNLGGGLHHAEPEVGAGFCVYNDIGVAIETLRAEGHGGPYAIVDLDFHEGNGNAVAYARDPDVLLYSIHGARWSHAGGEIAEHHLLAPGAGDEAYLALLEETLPRALARVHPKVVFYIAGNDVLAGDPLGGFGLSPQGVFARDQRVIALTERLGAGLVITLGGGYSAQAWECSASLVRALLGGRTQVKPAPRQRLAQQFARVAAQLDTDRLRGLGDDIEIRAEDVMPELAGEGSQRLLLGYYSAEGVEYALERYGILAKLRQRGFRELEVDVDAERQITRVRGHRAGHVGAPMLLIELALSRASMPAPDGMDQPLLHLLVVEWLLLQDPTQTFSLARPPLPGQEFPGLGLTNEIREMLVQTCHRLRLDGVINRPAHYHNGVLASRWFRFLRPEDEARFAHMREALHDTDIWEATRLMDDEGLALEDGTRLRWRPEEQVQPVSPALQAWFDSEAFQQAVRQARSQLAPARPPLLEDPTAAAPP